MFRVIRVTVNGTSREIPVDERECLTDTLRSRLGLTSVKKGCEVGECGACTVLIEGEAVNTCMYPAVWADGKSVLTLEGIKAGDGTLHPIQQAFIDETAVQCGFCTPGIIMTALALLNTGRRYTREELRREISGHLCRCTGYENILNALEKVIGPEAKPCCSSATEG